MADRSMMGGVVATRKRFNKHHNGISTSPSPPPPPPPHKEMNKLLDIS